MKKFLFYLLVLSLGTFVACEDVESEAKDGTMDVAEDVRTGANNVVNSTRDAVNNAADNMSADLTNPAATVRAVQDAGGLTKLDPTTAVAVIDGYINKLSSMDGTEGITSKLRELKGELTQSSIDGSKVGMLLKDLGMNTSNVGQGNASLMSLGQALTQAGNDLSN